MIKKTITYTDFNDNVQTGDFYFNLSKAELTTMQIEMNGGMVEHLTAIQESGDKKALVEVFKDLINRSYGEKSEDGKLFVKSPERTEAFTHHAAYEALFLEMLTDITFATEFFNGLMPKDMQAQAAAMQEKTASQIARENSEAQMQGRRAAAVKEPVTITKEKELLTVSDADLVQPDVAAQTNAVLQNMSPAELQELARQHVANQAAANLQ